MNYWLFIIPVISAFIGWVTNWIAIKMLFHSRQPKKIWVLLSRSFSKNATAICGKLGKLISAEFLSFTGIEQKISDSGNLKKIMPMIESHIDNFLQIKLKDEMPVLNMFIGDKTISSLKKVFVQEIEIIFPQVMK